MYGKIMDRLIEADNTVLLEVKGIENITEDQKNDILNLRKHNLMIEIESLDHEYVLDKSAYIEVFDDRIAVYFRNSYIGWCIDLHPEIEDGDVIWYNGMSWNYNYHK